jgi:hypothetical protein
MVPPLPYVLSKTPHEASLANLTSLACSLPGWPATQYIVHSMYIAYICYIP